MLNDMARAALVIAVMPDGEISVIKNTGGSRMSADGLKALGRLLRPEDRQTLIPRHNDTHHKLREGGNRLTDIDACATGDRR